MATHLSTTVAALPRIGEKGVKDLQNLGITCVRDLLWYLPFRYDDYSIVKKIVELKNDDTATFEGTIKAIGLRPSKSRRVKLIEATVEDETGSIKIVWFNQSFLLNTLPVGSRASFAGIVNDRYGKSMTSPVHEPIGRRVHTGRMVPVYGLSGTLQMRRLRDAIEYSLKCVDEMVDWLPDEIREQEKFPTLAEAIRSIHFPESKHNLESAIERLKFDELFLHQLLFAEIRADRKKKLATAITIDESSLKEFVETLPFKLTRAQKTAAWEIVQDMSKDISMNRLLEGDVGSGKTVVAAIATHHAIHNEEFVAYLAPTEILAVQQHKAFCRFFPNKQIALLTHNHIYLNEEKLKRAELFTKIEEKLVHCILGTHALLQEGIDLKTLALVIVDEQHRFGVEQRHALLELDPHHAPHLLSMTATPIPRSLALTLYGDLELSILDELPKGRKPIGTALVPEKQMSDMWQHVRSEVEKGRQVFVVCPLIDPSDKFGSRSVVEIEKMLREGPLKGLRIETLHGKLKSDEKQKRNEAFRDGKVDVLIATTVIEVGIDVPNATVMVIMSAERFGLAQLHQLRGRVGRSDLESYCYLLPDTMTQKTRERLQAVVDSQNGFEIAEKDLEFRGAGNVFGNAQSGFPDFRLATLADADIMKKARDWATDLLLKKDFFETHPLAHNRVKESFEHVHLE